MNKELQNLAWSVLPKEYREEVKHTYFRAKSNGNEQAVYYITYLFGEHNLTSDAEPEEMLTVSRRRVQNLYNYHKSRGHHLAGDSLIKLFGSKCLPDESESPKLSKVEKVGKDCNVDSLPTNVDSSDDCKAEPKFKVGDKVRFKRVYTVESVDDGQVFIDSAGNSVDENCLEPYTEPKEDKAEEIANKAIKPVEKHFDTILKDSFRNERRLNIATQIMSAILSNQRMLNNLAHGETTAEGVVKCVVDATMMYTDVLISACEKGEYDEIAKIISED